MSWLNYSKPVQVGDKWVVTITDTQNVENESREEFDSFEEAEAFVKQGVSENAQEKDKKEKREGNYINANYKIIELTPEQKKFVEEHWNNPEYDLKRLTQETFKNPKLNGHNTEAKSIKVFMASLGNEDVKVKTTQYVKKGPYRLTDHQKASVDAFLNSDEPPATKEMFKLIFPEVELTNPLIPEYQALCRYIKEVNEEAMDIWDEPVETRRYKAPRSYTTVLGLVNRYVSNPIDPSRALYDPNNMKPSQERNLKALLSYMQSKKFELQGSQYDKKADRDLFESTFVRQVQDKASDLTPEEVDMYVSVAAETVSVAQIERAVIKQERKIDECLDASDDDGTKARLSMSLVESVNSLREKLDKSKGRLKGLIESVAGSRKDRLDSKANQNDALVNLINLWAQEKTRNELIALAKKEHLEDATEIERLTTMDETWALIAGMSKQEALHGPQ